MKNPAMQRLQILACLLTLSLFQASGALASSDTANKLRQVDWQEWGIEPIHARVTANGYMIEFRYKVVDPEKATILSDRKRFPYMLSMKSRAKLSVPYFPTVGFIKSNRKFLHPGKNYTAMFSNEGTHMLRGDQVRIQVRDQVSQVLTLQ